MKYYLAFKGVNENLQSAWIKGKLCRQYAIGKTMRTHPCFPFYLATCYNDGWRLNIGCPSPRVLLVKVSSTHLKRETPWYNGPGGPRHMPYLPLNELCKHSKKEHDYWGTTRLLVLEEVNWQRFNNANVAMGVFEKKYNIPRLEYETQL